MAFRTIVGCLAFVLASCATAPGLQDASRSGVWGYLQLVPRDGVSTGTMGSANGYEDSRYADAQLVDYTQPGFAVVYLDGNGAVAAPVTLRIRSGLEGMRLEPARAVLVVGSEVTVRNDSDRPHVVTCPGAGVLKRLDPGQALVVPTRSEGELGFFLPGVAGAEARVFASPGPFSRVDESGRYEILGVEPGSHRIHAWHPRFPPRARSVVLSAGRVERMDFELGAGLGTDAD